MTISKDLFLSILAMDAYNRGYDAGINDEGENDPDELGNGQIGGASIVNLSTLGIGQAELDAWKDDSFYALAYDIGSDGPAGLAGQTVLSYRDTNDATDYLTGWLVGAGDISTGTQAGHALEFYNAVKAASCRAGENPPLGKTCRLPRSQPFPVNLGI